MSREIITIKERHHDQVLASAVESEHVQLFEGAWYFDADHVDMSHLVITERTYVCPYKGTCYWIDLKLPGYEAQDVAFTYFKVHPGYEFVHNKFGFYAGAREATYEETAVITDTIIANDATA
ncbi:MAG: DUF427 domain-containing protein [Anaerolineales bacterium]|nr:DUF427 domain-containing protein [Anaerolineales bacterium]MCB8968835.1 DUF427 domain-containing protein [Ardenticatenaceae bacterium]